MHLQLRLPIDSVHNDVVELQVALYHLYLRVRLVQLFVVAVATEYHNLKMLGQVSKTVNCADADPHIVRLLIILITAVISEGVGLLLNILLRHDVVLLCGDATVLEKVAQYALEVYDDYRMLELVGTTTEIVPKCSLEVLISLRVQLHFNVFLLDLRRLLNYWLLGLRFADLLLLLLLQLGLALLSQMCHTVLMRVICCCVFHAHFGSLAILCHGLRIFVALVAQLQDARLLRHAEASVFRTVDGIGRDQLVTWYELVTFPGDLLMRHVLFIT